MHIASILNLVVDRKTFLDSIPVKWQRQILFVLNDYIRSFFASLLGVWFAEVGSHLHRARVVWCDSAQGHAILRLGVEIDSLSLVLGIELIHILRFACAEFVAVWTQTRVHHCMSCLWTQVTFSGVVQHVLGQRLRQVQVLTIGLLNLGLDFRMLCWRLLLVRLLESYLFVTALS